MVIFKHARYREQLKKLTPQARMIFDATVDCLEERYGSDIEIVVTSVYRRFDKGVHKYYRAFDLRVNAAWDATNRQVVKGTWSDKVISREQAQSATEKINQRYLYDAARPELKCLVYGTLDGEHKHDDHIHGQAHRNTRLVVSQQPDIGLDVNLAEDFEEEVPLTLSVPTKSDIAWMTARRVGKVVTAVGIDILLRKVGVPAGIGAIGYLGAEKAANATLEVKTGRKTNLDPISFVFEILEKLFRMIADKRKDND